MSGKDAVDIVIVGGGMVGSLLAAALGQANISVALVENHKPSLFDPASPYDLRVSALSLASENMLRAVGAWSKIEMMRTAPFRLMKVWDGEQGGMTTFDSEEVDQTHLGTIVENRIIQLALHQVLEDLPKVSMHVPASLRDFDVRPDTVDVVLDNGVTLQAKLLVGADGARSTVRELAGISNSSIRYPQSALVASVSTQSEQQNITWQRFLPSGPQALLPLQGSRASMVWYHSAEEVERLSALADDEFLQAMHDAFPVAAGELTGLLGRASFPLFCSHAESYIQDRVALVGDAAHSVHPLAGQGVNLGMLDAGMLAEVVVSARGRRRDVGLSDTLRPYERGRRAENAVMLKILDSFYHAFKPQPSGVQKVRSAALQTTQRFKPLRRWITEHAMGVRGDLPALAKSQVA